MTLEINFDIDRQLLDKAIDQKLDDSFIKHQKSQVTLTPFKWVLSGNVLCDVLPVKHPRS